MQIEMAVWSPFLLRTVTPVRIQILSPFPDVWLERVAVTRTRESNVSQKLPLYLLSCRRVFPHSALRFLGLCQVLGETWSVPLEGRKPALRYPLCALGAGWSGRGCVACKWREEVVPMSQRGFSWNHILFFSNWIRVAFSFFFFYFNPLALLQLFC